MSKTVNTRAGGAGARFRRLHKAGAPFVLVNVWDVGGARLMQSLGARALATSSAALAFVAGKADGGGLGRQESVAHGKAIAAATRLPVSADLENGYGESPAQVAATVRAAFAAGLAGCSIEDTALPAQTPYPFDLAVARVAAAARAARALPQDFVVTARADGVLTGQYGYDEARRRLLAFGKAGACCLYAPCLSLRELRALCAAVAPKPVNALVAGALTRKRAADFAAAGVARLSLGSSLARMTHRALLDAGKAMFANNAHFAPLAKSVDGEEINRLIL